MKTLFLSLLLTASMAFAQPRMGGMHRNQDHQGRMHDRIAAQLNLTADQQKQFDKLSSDLMKRQIAVRSKIATARVELKDLVNADKPDKSALLAKEAEVNKLQGELRANQIQFWFDVNTNLTADQQTIWKKALQRPAGNGFAARDGHGMMGPRGRAGRMDSSQ